MANWVMKKEAVIDKTSDGIGREVEELMNPTPFKERLNFWPVVNVEEEAL